MTRNPLTSLDKTDPTETETNNPWSVPKVYWINPTTSDKPWCYPYLSWSSLTILDPTQTEANNTQKALMLLRCSIPPLTSLNFHLTHLDRTWTSLNTTKTSKAISSHPWPTLPYRDHNRLLLSASTLPRPNPTTLDQLLSDLDMCLNTSTLPSLSLNHLCTPNPIQSKPYPQSILNPVSLSSSSLVTVEHTHTKIVYTWLATILPRPILTIS